jgi:hypothetical protein
MADEDDSFIIQNLVITGSVTCRTTGLPCF